MGLTMTDAEREMLLSPPSTDRMQITGADTARLDLNINIVVAERLGLKFIEVKLSPFLRVLNLEAFEGVWINHFDLNMAINNSTIPNIPGVQV